MNPCGTGFQPVNRTGYKPVPQLIGIGPFILTFDRAIDYPLTNRAPYLTFRRARPHKWRRLREGRDAGKLISGEGQCRYHSLTPAGG